MAVGAVLGWTASILTRTDDTRGILLSGLTGVAGAVAGGALASRDSLLFGLSATALLTGIAAAAVLLVGLSIARRQAAQ